MGKYMRKCKAVGKVAVMEVAQVGVRTRARAMAMATAAGNLRGEKRRKVGGSEELRFSSTSFAHLRATPENSVSPAPSSDQCVSAASDHVTSSCCSSNGSTEVPQDSLKSVDLEGESVGIETSSCSLDRIERGEPTVPSSEFQVESGELESTAEPPSAANPSRISLVHERPTEAELEKFFAAAEKNMRKQFAEKYNYDIEKDVPLEGRYEWVKLQP